MVLPQRVRRDQGARHDAESERAVKRTKSGAQRVAEEAVDYSVLAPDQLAAKLKKLEAQMYKLAQDLQFEEAARVRDELQRVKTLGLLS